MKDILIISISRLVTAAISVVSLRVITEALTPAEYGLYAIFVVFQVFCGLFFINPLGQYLNRNVHEWYDNGILSGKLISYNYYIVLFSFLGGIATVLWFVLSRSDVSLVLAFFVIVCAVYTGTWNATLVPMLNMLGFRKSSVICSVITSVSALAFSFLFVKTYSSAYAWLFGQTVAMLLGGLIALALYIEYGHQRIDKYNRQIFIKSYELKTYVLPLACATILLWFQSSGYRFFIERMYGLESLGLLAVGFGLANQLFGIAESLLMQILNPVFFRRISTATVSEGKHVLCDLIALLLPIYFFLASGLLICSSAFLTLLVSESYKSAIVFFFSGVMMELFRVVNSAIANAAQLEKKMSRLISPNLISGGAICSILYLSSIYKHELIYTAMFLPLAGLCGIFASVLKMRKYLLPTLINRRVLFSFFILVLAVYSVFVNKKLLISADTVPFAILVVLSCFTLSCAVLFVMFKRYRPFISLFFYK